MIRTTFVPVWLYFAHITVALLCFAYFVVMMVLYFGQKAKFGFFKKHFSSSLFTGSLLLYPLLNASYFVLSIIPVQFIQIVASVSNNFGATTFTISIMCFMIYWMEFKLFNGGASSKNIHERTNFSKYLVRVFLILVCVAQILLTSLKIVMYIVPNEQTFVLSGLQSLLLSLSYFCILGLSSFVMIMGGCDRRANEWENGRVKSTTTIAIIVLFWIFTFLRSVLHFGIAFLYFFNLFEDQLAFDIFHIAFPILFDWAAMLFMGVVVIIQEYPTKKNIEDETIVNLKKDDREENMTLGYFCY
eukprot:gene2568-3530_t